MAGRSTSYTARGLSAPRPGALSGRPRSLLARAFARPVTGFNESRNQIRGAGLFKRIQFTAFDRIAHFVRGNAPKPLSSLYILPGLAEPYRSLI